MTGSAERDPSGDGDFLPFDVFMEQALYSPDGGFYHRDAAVIGPKGEYYTAPQASPLYAKTFAGRIERALHDLPSSPAPEIVEVGPGDGLLAAGIIAELGRRPQIAAGLTYRLVDRATPRLEESFRAAQRASAATTVQVRRGTSLGADGPFRGVVILHELLDAQPVRRFEVSHGAWRELGVSASESRWVAKRRCPTHLPPAMPEPGGLEEGTIAEVAPAAESLLRDVADHLVDGVAIVVDYGMEEDELLRGHPGGTLQGLRGHRFVEDPLANGGPRDLSVFVNWTRLRRAAERAGLRPIADESLANALGAWGIEPLARAAQPAAPAPEESVRLQLGLKNLLFGFERFRVLEFVVGSRS